MPVAPTLTMELMPDAEGLVKIQLSASDINAPTGAEATDVEPTKLGYEAEEIAVTVVPVSSSSDDLPPAVSDVAEPTAWTPVKLEDEHPAKEPVLAAPIQQERAAVGPPAEPSSTACESSPDGLAAIMQEESTPTNIPTSQNGTATYGLSPPTSPHPLDNPRPPTFLQVDASYRGLLFCDGYDSHGRPVIVLNTSALPPKARKDEALEYLKQQLSPVVNQGPYVLVLVACTEGPNGGPQYKSLPSLWTVSAYRSLARPFRKHVKFIIMVNPSLLVRAVLAIVKPFVKQKAYHKLKKVKVLADLDQVTNGEVRMEHLGQRFLATLQQRPAA